VSKTINKEALRFELMFHDSNGQTLKRNANWGQTITVELVCGHWQIDVNAYLGNDLHATGSRSVEVITGQENSVEIILRWTMDIVGISITAPPGKLLYNIGEPLNLAGIAVEATYNDGSSGPVTITMDNITGNSFSTSGEKTVTVNYGGKTDTFAVRVDGTKSLNTITINPLPAKTTYIVGEPLIITGMVVRANYSDSSTAIISHDELVITGFNSSTTGEKTVIVRYGGAAADFPVQVIPPTLTGTLTITSNSGYYKGAILTANTNGISGSYGSPVFQWSRDNIPIFGGTAKTYTVKDADKGTTLSVVVSYSNGQITSDRVQIHSGEPVNSLDGITRTGHFVLTRDITVTATKVFSGTGSGISYFAGTLDGNGHTITLSITAAPVGSGQDTMRMSGVFYGIADAGVVKNVRLAGSITVPSVSTAYAGALAGENKGTIINVSSKATVKINESTAYSYAGGIVGNNKGGLIQNCYSTGSVTLSRLGPGTLRAGGIVGNQESSATVQYCWTSGNVSITGSSYQSAGGIAGVIMNNGGTVSDCAALNGTISITASASNDRGRVAGSAGTSTILSDNHANSGMSGSASAGTNHNDGENVTLTTTEQAGGAWWQTKGWTTSLNWGGAAANEEKPWKWPASGTFRPILFFESGVNQ